MNNKKETSAKLSIFSNILLIIMKLIVGFLSGSVSVISDGIHSCIDLGTAIITFGTIKTANKPPDDMHPYGHGKYENIGSIISGLLILGTGIVIIINSVKGLFYTQAINNINLAFLVMVVSLVINLLMAMYLREVGENTDSEALKSESIHRFSDFISSLGIAFGVILIKVTGILSIDVYVSIIVGIIICYESKDILKNSFNSLIDHSLPKSEINQIEEVLNKYKDSYKRYYNLRTRKSGSERFIQLQVIVDPSMTVEDSGLLCIDIKRDIEKVLKNTNVLIQIEAFAGSCKININEINKHLIVTYAFKK
jgi:cation diffusion facilitator family transporter